jgi:hypothetical protein
MQSMVPGIVLPDYVNACTTRAVTGEILQNEAFTVFLSTIILLKVYKSAQGWFSYIFDGLPFLEKMGQ